jgi:hypothetical protein
MISTEFISRFSNSVGEKAISELGEQLVLLKERIEFTRALMRADTYEDKRQIELNILAYRQMLLHRAIMLFEASLHAAERENVYSLALSIRGHFEATAAIGYITKKLISAQSKNIKISDIGKAMATVILGSKSVDSKFNAPSPKQVMTMLDDADHIVNKLILKEPNKTLILRDSYEFLCEYAHPNFHSNSCSFDLDKGADLLHFRHGGRMRQNEDRLIKYLLLSCPIFVLLYDGIPELLPK